MDEAGLGQGKKQVNENHRRERPGPGRWLRTLRQWRHNSEPLYLPADLGLQGLLALRSFVHKTVRIDQSRGRFRPNREDVAVETTGSRTMECHSLPVALDTVPSDEIKEIILRIRTGRHRVTTIVWRCDGTGHVVVSGKSLVWTRGVRGVLEDFLVDREYQAQELAPASWRLQGWSELPVQIIAGIIAGGILMLVGVVLRLLG